MAGITGILTERFSNYRPKRGTWGSGGGRHFQRWQGFKNQYRFDGLGFDGLESDQPDADLLTQRF